MAGSTEKELQPLAVAVRGKARAGMIIYIGTIVAIFSVPLLYSPPSVGYPLGVSLPFYLLFTDYAGSLISPEGSLFYGFWVGLLYVDYFACAITTACLYRWMRNPTAVNPSSSYYTYVPYWVHFFTMFISTLMTATMCTFQSQCWMISPLGLVLVAVGIFHLLVAREYTLRIYIARLDTRSGSSTATR